MAEAPKIDVRDLNSVRRAAGGRAGRQAAGTRARPGSNRGLRLNRSPLARRIIAINLVAVLALIAGLLHSPPSRDTLVRQRANALISEARLVASALEARLASTVTPGLAVDQTLGGADLRPPDPRRGSDPPAGPDQPASADPLFPPGLLAAPHLLAELDLQGGIEVFLFNTTGQLIGHRSAPRGAGMPTAGRHSQSTLLLDLLHEGWERLAKHPPAPAAAGPLDTARALAARAPTGDTLVEITGDAEGRTLLAVAHSIRASPALTGTVVLTTAAGEIDALLRQEREQMLRMVIFGILMSIALSLILSSAIARPLAALAAAAEGGRDPDARSACPERIHIPDLTARRDEIGRLSAAMRGMVAALYDRIESNEQFAADITHEIRNPLASLRSATGTLRIAGTKAQREKLLDIIEHDVLRLDRLVTDISTASRLDSDLVKEEESPFDLMQMLDELGEHLGHDAGQRGVDFSLDLLPAPLVIRGLETRLAQVFVNLIDNALSFCEPGDAIRLWTRRHDNRVLVVIEDTGPGIPEASLSRVFQRFYSERPPEHFGNNSGLGLAISRQIVEAHGGVIWAENIHPTAADPTSDPSGARFIVGLPV